MPRTRLATSSVLSDFPESSHHLYRKGVSVLSLGDIGTMYGDILVPLAPTGWRPGVWGTVPPQGALHP